MKLAFVKLRHSAFAEKEVLSLEQDPRNNFCHVVSNLHPLLSRTSLCLNIYHSSQPRMLINSELNSYITKTYGFEFDQCEALRVAVVIVTDTSRSN